MTPSHPGKCAEKSIRVIKQSPNHEERHLKYDKTVGEMTQGKKQIKRRGGGMGLDDTVRYGVFDLDNVDNGGCSGVGQERGEVHRCLAGTRPNSTFLVLHRHSRWRVFHVLTELCTRIAHRLN